LIPVDNYKQIWRIRNVVQCYAMLFIMKDDNKKLKFEILAYLKT